MIKNKAEQAQQLQGMRVLVADDDFLIAIAIEETLKEAGAEVLGVHCLPP